jgi:hypothetical protein
MRKPVMMETMNGILAAVVVPVVVGAVVVGAVVVGAVVVGAVVVGAVVVGAVVVGAVVVGAVVVGVVGAVVVGAVVAAGTNIVVVGTVVAAGTNIVVVGTVVALVILIVWSMRRLMRLTMTTMVGTMASVFVVATIMMMAVIKGQTAAIAVVMMAAGRVALWTHRNEVAKMYCLCLYSY